MSENSSAALEIRTSEPVKASLKLDSLEISVRHSLEFLKATERFSDVRVGYDGGTSYEACAFSIISHSDHFRETLYHLYENGGDVGKIYALIGLYSADKRYFQKAFDELERSEANVTTQSGCIVHTESIKSILKSDSPDVVRLSEGFPTIDSWIKFHNNEDESCSIDVLGGAYSEIFSKQARCAPMDFEDELRRRKLHSPSNVVIL